MKTWFSLLAGLFLSSSIVLPVKAQITVDGTTNTNLTPIDTGIRIDDGDRAGNNLFHSFEQFSILNGSEAFFNNANDIVNIFSRVTGGNISTIDGLLRANGTANLFLLNPAGIIFGENAQLDIGGSFLSSTADSIVFGDGVEFLAKDSDNPPLLTINMPIGLNLGNNPGQIINRSYNGNGLEVATGESITLVGGNINLEGGKLFAPGGRVELGGLSAAGEIGINTDGSLVFPEGVTRADVLLTNGARVDVRAGGEGSIGVNAHNIELSGGELGASFLSAGIAENTGSPEAQAGDITLNATNTITVSQGSGIRNQVEEFGVGNAGEIKMTTANLLLTEGSQVDASTFGEGNAGAIIINASGTISAEGENQETSTGIISRIRESGVGNAGGVYITTNNLYLNNGGRVSTSTFGEGNAGEIIINASGTISAEGATQEGIPSGIFSVILPAVRGKSNGIDITTNNLYLTKGSRVSSRTVGEGNAGVIIINASGTIFVDGKTQAGFTSGIFSLAGASAEGDANDINIKTNNLLVTNNAEISVESLGKGNAGDLFIQANSIALENGSSLFASTPVETGGSITLDIAEILTLRDNSTISAQALEDANGGNVTINSDLIVAFPNQNNDIIASAEEGNGGEINITTRGIFGIEERSSTPPNNTNDIDASSEFGLDGTININELDTNPAEAIENSPKAVIDPDKLVLLNLCSLARDSEFYYTAKGGNAPNLAQVREEGVIAVDLVEPVPFEEEEDLLSRGAVLKDTASHKGQRSRGAEEAEEVEKEIVEAQGWVFHENGVVELVAYKTDPNGIPAQPKDPRVCPK